jgi:thiosulfate dehydrogenase (quinone) large subunit
MASVQNAVTAVIGEPLKRASLPGWEGLKGSRIAALAWTAMRVWLGVMWIQAGSAKIWGAEAAGFLHNNGAGVAGFAAHGTPAYSWWGSFLHGFVVPNAGPLGVLIAVAEFAIGVALVAGLFTRVAALGSLALLFTYVMSGTASVCAFYALFAIVILVMWRTSSWIGIDGLFSAYRQRHPGLLAAHPRIPGTRGTVGTAAAHPVA